MQPKVTIICLAYNQEKFIKQALDGFVMQKTNFPFQVIVHDDASTDKTADIIRAYAKKYPDIIKPIFQENNLFGSGKARSILADFIAPKIKSKYVAICDGDDYWTDSHKLQRQADFLDRHPSYTICFSPITVFFEDDSQTPESRISRWGENLSFNRLLHENFILNSSVMYRWNFNPDLWPNDIYPGDWYLHLLHAKQGKIGYIPKMMVRYRRHSNGISYAGTFSENQLHLQYGLQELNFFLAVEKNIVTNPTKYHAFICAKARDLCYLYIKCGFLNKAEKVLKLCPDAFEQRKMDSHEKYKKYQHRFNRLLVLTAVLFVLLVVSFIV